MRWKTMIRIALAWIQEIFMYMPHVLASAVKSLGPSANQLGQNPAFERDNSPTPSSRQERLNRGIIALNTNDGIFVSWRLFRHEDAVFGDAKADIAFTLFRNDEPIATISESTCYLDHDGTMDSQYRVVSTTGDESKTVTPLQSGSNYFDIPLERPSASAYGEYTIGDTSVGDLDGDGEYELVVKWNSNPKDNSIDGFTGNVLLDAYRIDGTRLWKNPIDLGQNIRAGAHYTQFLVYDFDGDGKSEITCKTAPGSRDATGCFVSQASQDESIRSCDNAADYRNECGRVLEGDEFFTIFSGQAGKALDTIYYPNQRISTSLWGDDYGNRVDRFLATVAYLDGVRPYAVYMRGYYMGKNGNDTQRQTACAITFDGQFLRCCDSFDTYDVNRFRDKEHSNSFLANGTYKGVQGYSFGNWRYAGQGNHNCVVADVDGDGRDEVITGALCYELNSRGRFGVKWCTFLGHGDAIHIGAHNPQRAGYDLFTVHEEHGINKLTGTIQDCGMSLIDAATGKIRFHVGASSDTGRGMMANVGAGGHFQFWGASGAFHQPEGNTAPRMAVDDGTYDPIDLGEISTNFRIFWDGDLYDELLDGTPEGNLEVTSWNGSEMEVIFTTEGCTSINETKQTPCLQADILGDWREEILVARADNAAIRVYTTDIPTRYKMMTLMHDPVYRQGIATQQTGYNQPPHIGFYVNENRYPAITGTDST